MLGASRPSGQVRAGDPAMEYGGTACEVIECEPQRRPGGLYWNHLTADKIAAVPVLAARAAARRG